VQKLRQLQPNNERIRALEGEVRQLLRAGPAP